MNKEKNNKGTLAPCHVRWSKLRLAVAQARPLGNTIGEIVYYQTSPLEKLTYLGVGLQKCQEVKRKDFRRKIAQPKCSEKGSSGNGFVTLLHRIRHGWDHLYQM